MNKKILGFISLLGGAAVLAGNFVGSLEKYNLVLIGAIVACASGLLALFSKSY